MQLGRYFVIWHLVLTSTQSSGVISRTFCKQNTIGCGAFTITCQVGVIAIEQVLYQQDKYCDSITEFEQRVNCCCVDSIANDTAPVGFATDDINKTCHGQPSCSLNVFMNNKPGKITIEYTCEATTTNTTCRPAISSTQSPSAPEITTRTSSVNTSSSSVPSPASAITTSSTSSALSTTSGPCTIYPVVNGSTNPGTEFIPEPSPGLEEHDQDGAVLPVLLTLMFVCLIALTAGAVIYLKRRHYGKSNRHVSTVENPNYDHQERNSDMATDPGPVNHRQSALQMATDPGPVNPRQSALQTATDRNSDLSPYDGQDSVSSYDHVWRCNFETTLGGEIADKHRQSKTSDETVRVSAYDSVVHFQRLGTGEIAESSDETYNTTREERNSRPPAGDTYDCLAVFDWSTLNN